MMPSPIPFLKQLRLRARRHPRLGRGLLLGFVPFAVLLMEWGHLQSWDRVAEFVLRSPGAFLFGWMAAGLVYSLLLAVLRRGWAAALLTGGICLGLSAAEYYKYAVSGTHLLASDLMMTSNMEDVASFGQLTFNLRLAVAAALLVGYVAALWWCGSSPRVRPVPSLAASAGAVALAGLLAVSQPAFDGLCRLMGIDTRPAVDAFSQEERFETNQLAASLTLSMVEELDSALDRRPTDYSRQAVEQAVEEGEEETPDFPEGQLERPNLVVVMSESFADLRTLTDQVPPETYAPYDRVAEEGFRGSCVVPTFGGYTVKSEFELLFGLPVRGLQNAPLPTHLLDDEERQYQAMPQFYRRAGYTTTYIHPFSGSFYGRGGVYGRCGFDQMFFLEDFDPQPETFHLYTDDEAAFRKAEEVMAQTPGRALIVITTMQNHKPYSGGDSPLDYYLEGIGHSCRRLEEFTQRLKEWDEPVLVLFVGDHYPFFGGEDTFYTDAGIGADTSRRVFNQSWILWSNRPLDRESLPQEQVSLFYLPHLLYRQAGAGESGFVDAMLGQMETTPLYSPITGGQEVKNLDLLAYDRTLGEGYSDRE